MGESRPPSIDALIARFGAALAAAADDQAAFDHALGALGALDDATLTWKLAARAPALRDPPGRWLARALPAARARVDGAGDRTHRTRAEGRVAALTALAAAVGGGVDRPAG